MTKKLPFCQANMKDSFMTCFNRQFEDIFVIYIFIIIYKVPLQFASEQLVVL